MEEIYDINFIIPVSDLPEYSNRVDDLKKYGIVNIQNYKIKITLLLGPSDHFDGQNLLVGWNGQAKVELLRTPYIFASQKIAFYYSRITSEEINSSLWHFKIDDDSANDVSSLIESLSDFDPSDRLYLVTEIRYEIEDIEKEILQKMNKHNWLHGKEIKHEYEACILSRTAMLSIKENQKAQQYLEYRMSKSGGFGDQLVGIALKFCKLRPMESGFMTVHPRVNEFSLFGGKFSHIHFFRGRDDGKEKIFQFFSKLLSRNYASKKFENRIFYHDGMQLKLLENNQAFLGKDPALWTAIEEDKVAFSFDEGEGCRLNTYKVYSGKILL